jgi:hypothetical protein
VLLVLHAPFLSMAALLTMWPPVNQLAFKGGSPDSPSVAVHKHLETDSPSLAVHKHLEAV